MRFAYQPSGPGYDPDAVLRLGWPPRWSGRAGVQMIKDIVFHLSTRTGETAAIDYAVSVAGAFEAHIAGIAFALDPFIPPPMGIGDAIPADWIDDQREEAE